MGRRGGLARVWDRPQQRPGSRVATSGGRGGSIDTVEMGRRCRSGLSTLGAGSASTAGPVPPPSRPCLPVPCLPFPAGSGGLWPRSPRCASGSISGARGIPGPTPRSLVAHSHVSVVERGLGLSLGLLWALLIHEDRAPTECIKCALSSGDNRSRRIPCSGRDSKASPCGNLGTVFLRRSHKGLGTPALRAQLWTRPPPPCLKFSVPRVPRSLCTGSERV